MTIRSSLAVLAASAALTVGLAAPAHAAPTDPDTLPTIPTSEDCRVVKQTPWRYQVQCGPILRTYQWSHYLRRYVQISIQWVR